MAVIYVHLKVKHDQFFLRNCGISLCKHAKFVVEGSGYVWLGN